MVKIDNIELGEFPLLLAPMEDVSDPPFRFVCKKHGADLSLDCHLGVLKEDGVFIARPKILVGRDYAGHQHRIAELCGHGRNKRGRLPMNLFLSSHCDSKERFRATC